MICQCLFSEIANNSSSVILSEYNWNSQTKGHPFYWCGKIQDRPPHLPELFNTSYDQRKADFDLNTNIFLSPLIHSCYLQHICSHYVFMVTRISKFDLSHKKRKKLNKKLQTKTQNPLTHLPVSKLLVKTILSFKYTNYKYAFVHELHYNSSQQKQLKKTRLTAVRP